MDRAIVNYVKRRHNLLIGETSAEQIKIAIGSACRDIEPLVMEVKGRDLVAGVPRVLELKSPEIWEALAEPVNAIAESVKMVLERTPPELSADMIDRGVVLVGGAAQLRDMDRLLSQVTGLPVVLADDPLTAVALGTGRCLEELSLLRDVALSSA